MREKGQNLTEFIIILALVVIAGVFVYTMLGNNVKEMFKKSHKSSQQYKPFEWGNQSNKNSSTKEQKKQNLQVGVLGGTLDKPVTACTGNNCTIDFGDFTLTDVPEDFGDFISSNGTSGGTEKIAKILMQLIKQLENTDTDLDINLIKQLANQGFSISSAEKELEKNAIESLNRQITTYRHKITGAADKVGNQTIAFNKILEQVQLNNSNTTKPLDKDVINIVNALSLEINTLSMEIRSQANYTVNNAEKMSAKVQLLQTGVITDANISTTTKLDSTIICATGKGHRHHMNCK